MAALVAILPAAATALGCVPADCDPTEHVDGDSMDVGSGTTRLWLTLEPYLDPLTHDVDVEIRVGRDPVREGALPITVTLALAGTTVASQTAVTPYFGYGGVEACIGPCSFELDITLDPADVRSAVPVVVHGSEPHPFLDGCPSEQQGTYVLTPR